MRSRAACMRAASAALRSSVGSLLRKRDTVVAGPGARWFAALLVDRAVAASGREAVTDPDIGVVAERLRVKIQSALDDVRRAGQLAKDIGVRAGWTVIEPRDGQNPLRDLRHALRGAAVLARVEERRATLLAAITHELRTPLTSIVGYAEQLRDGGWNEKAKRNRALSIVSDEAKRLSRLVDGLIDMGAWQSGRLVLRRTSARLRPLVDRALAAVAVRAAERRARVTIRGDAATHVDVDRIVQVLINLLDNAIRYATDEGVVRVAIGERSGSCTLTIVDDGPGFDPKLAGRIGEPFAAGDGGRVGLGFAISKMLVVAHGGSIEVHRRARRGTRVIVALPVTVRLRHILPDNAVQRKERGPTTRT